jgi:hypothetical protein
MEMMIALITDKDYLIIRYLEKYKFCTIGQLEKIFYREQQYSYNIVRKRLEEMIKAKYIKEPVKNLETNKNVYIYNDKDLKPPNHHRLILLDLLAEMIYSGFNVEQFEIEKSWADGKFRSDAFAVFTIPDGFGSTKKRKYHFFIEVQLSNNYHNLNKYDELYKTYAVQNYLNKDFYPNKILLISDKTYPKIELQHAQVIQLDTKLSLFPIILL